jgi:hypothetical protein
VKKFYFPLLILFFAVCGYSFLSKQSPRETYFGDADAVGTEEDALERVHYDWEMLHDPATGKIPDNIREKELAFTASLPNDAMFNGALMKGTAVTWNPRGPWNVGGRTRALAIDAANNNNLIAGSTSGGMWRSTDGGQHWLPTLTPDQYKSVSCLTQDTRINHRNVWYYGTGEGVGASASESGAYYYGNGIYKSVDSGKTWTVLPNSAPTSYTSFSKWGELIWTVVTNPTIDSQDVVYAAAYAGVYRSTDGGNNWTLVAGTPINILNTSYYTDVAISPSGIVYIALSSDGLQKGIFRSVDGVNFTDITPANFPPVYDRIKIGISPSDETKIYFIANTPGYGQANANYLGTVEWNSLWKYTYLSGNGSGTGGNWEDRSLNLPSTGGPFDIFQSQGSYDLVVKVKPDDPNTVFIGGTNIYRSTNGFSDTNQTTYIGGYKKGATLPIVLAYNNHHPDQHEMVFYPGNPKKMISSNDGGIFVTDDNTANNVVWQSLNNGYLTSMFYTCAIDHASTDAVVVGGAQDNGSWFTNSTNLLTPWVSPRGGDGSYCAIADNKNAYYFSIQNGKVMRAKLNASGAIDSFARIDPLLGKNYLFINPFTLDPNNNNIMYLAGGNFLWRNDNLSGIPYASNWDSIATNWVRFNDSLPVSGAKISCIAVSTTPANRVYFGTSSRRVYRIDNANNGTPTPVDVSSYVPASFFPTAYVSCVAVDPTNADHVMVTYSNYGVYSIFYSEDGGTTWTKAAGNLEQFPAGSGNGPSVRWARIMPVTGGTVFLVGTSAGLYATTKIDGLNTVWVQQGTNNIGSSIVNMIDSRPTDGTVVLATHSHGMFSGTITNVNDIATPVNNLVLNPSSFNLSNFPNPFKNQTTISFHLQHGGYGRLDMLDAMGNNVKSMAALYFEDGDNHFTLHTEDIAPGIYYCLLQIGNEKALRKMMVL